MNTLILMLMLLQGENPIYVDRIALKVNDQIVTQRELVMLYKQRRQEYLQVLKGAELEERMKKAWEETLTEAQEQLLLYVKAVDLGIAPSEDDIRSQLNAMRESNGMSEEDFEKAIMEQAGMNIEEYVAYRLRDSGAQSTVHAKVITQIKIDDSEIAKYFDEHKAEFMIPEKYRIAEIALLKGEKDPLALKMMMKEVESFLATEKDFTRAVQRFSESPSKENGGDLGWSEYGDLQAAIENVVKNLKEGEISAPVETDSAFFLIKVLEKKAATPKPIQDVRAEILSKLRAPRMDAKMKSYLEELKASFVLQTFIKEPPPELGI